MGINNSVEDGKNTLIEVFVAMDERGGIYWKRLEETTLLPEAPAKATSAAASISRAGVESVVPPLDQNLELPLSTFPKFGRRPGCHPLVTERHKKDTFRFQEGYRVEGAKLLPKEGTTRPGTSD